MKISRSQKFAIPFALALAGCGNQSGDERSARVEKGPWYEVGSAEAPSEPWPREILKEGIGPVTAPGSAVFVTVVSEPVESMLEIHKAEFIKANQRKIVLWLGSPPPAPEGFKTILSFSIGDNRFRSTLIDVREGSKLRITIPREGQEGKLPLNGMNGFDSESPEYNQKFSLGRGSQLVEIDKVCEAKLYARDGVFHEVGLKSHGERGFTLTRTWRVQWGKLEGTCHGEPFKREIGPNSIEEAHSRGAQINRGQ